MFNSIFIKKSIKKQTIALAFVCAFFFATPLIFPEVVNAATGINKQINFQGKVVNSDGTNVANGSYSFIFSLYSVSSAGSAIWTETKTLTVTDGIFRTDLGDTTALPGSVDFNTDNIYLGINFNSDGEMTPRVRLDAVPQAFNADKIDGLDSTSLLRSDTSNAFTSGTLTFNDSTVLALGTGNDLQLTHNGTDSSITSATGNLTINNTNATGVTIAKLGTGTSATSFQIQNSSGAALFTINGAGALTASAFSTNGGLLYTNGSGVLAQTGAGTSTTVLHGGTTPTYGAIVLSTDTSGTLPIANGGTNNSSAYTAGSVVYSDGTKLTQDNSNFFWDATNHRLGIGTTSPSNLLHIQNNINGDSAQLLVDNANALGGSSIVINRSSNVRVAQVQLSLSGTPEWYAGELRKGGSNSNNFSISTVADSNVTPPQFTVTSSGFVGLGVLSPGGTLTILSTNATGTTTSSATSISANSLTSGTGLYVASSSLTSGKAVDIQVSGTAAAASQTALNILTAGATATNAITTYGAQISNTHTNATSGTNVALYLNASGATTANYGLIVNAGNVGIGDTSPAALLTVGSGDLFQVNSSGAIAAATGITSSGTITLTSSATTGTTTSSVTSIAANSLTSGTALYIASSNSGQTSDKFIDISQTGVTTGFTGNLINLSSSSTTGAATFIKLAADSSTVGIGQSISMNAITTGQALTIASSATTGITTAGTNKGSLLDVTESGAMSAMTGQLVSINASGTNTSGATGSALNINIAGTGQVMNGINIVDATTTAVTGAGISISMPSVTTTSGLRYLRFKNAAGTEIGSISNSTASAIAFNTSSDRRLKSDIVQTHYGLDDLLKVGVRDFVWNSDGSQDTGFIAQDLYNVFPNAVMKGDNGTDPYVPGVTHTWSIDYGRVTPLLASAIQEQQGLLGTYTEGADISSAISDASEQAQDPLQIITSNADAGKKILTNLIATQLTAMRGNFDNVSVNTIAGKANGITIQGNTVFAGDITANHISASSIDGFSEMQATIADILAQLKAQAGDALSPSELTNLLAQSLNFAGNIAFAKDVTMNGGLIADAISINKTLVVNGTSNFKGEVTVSNSQAGFAKILKYASSVDVKFVTPLVNTPVVQVTAQGNSPAYWVDSITTKGFTLHVASDVSQDISYSWTAITAQDPKTTVSDPGATPTQTPDPTALPTATPAPTPVITPIPTDTPTPTPTVDPTPTDTPTPEPTISPT